MTITYAEDYTLFRKVIPSSTGNAWNAHGQDQFGYGRKITTSIVLRFDGEKRIRRVYATCFSNCASHWIEKGGKVLHLRTHFQDEIKEYQNV